MKQYSLRSEFVHHMPKELNEGVLYISHPFHVAVHLCACGCGQKTVTPLKEVAGDPGWKISHRYDTISRSQLSTLTPSIGNFKGQNPYHAHYYITEGKVVWL